MFRGTVASLLTATTPLPPTCCFQTRLLLPAVTPTVAAWCSSCPDWHTPPSPLRHIPKASSVNCLKEHQYQTPDTGDKTVFLFFKIRLSTINKFTT